MSCALAGSLGGVFHDRTGSYLASFALPAALLALSDACIWIASVAAVANYDSRLWVRAKN